MNAILLFADNTNTLIKGKTTKDSLEKAQETLQVVQDWLRGNKIKTNRAKGKYIVFNLIVKSLRRGSCCWKAQIRTS